LLQKQQKIFLIKLIKQKQTKKQKRTWRPFLVWLVFFWQFAIVSGRNIKPKWILVTVILNKNINF